MKKAVRIYIRGAVQGVFFRSFVKENAEKLNVKGFVRNLEDGRVEAFLEGNGEDVRKMIELCRKGPKHGKVDGLDMKKESFQGFRNFKIMRI